MRKSLRCLAPVVSFERKSLGRNFRGRGKSAVETVMNVDGCPFGEMGCKHSRLSTFVIDYEAGIASYGLNSQGEQCVNLQ